MSKNNHRLVPSVRLGRLPPPHDQTYPRPDGYTRIETASVWLNGESGELVIDADPREVWPDDEGEHDDGSPHNCDAMGCGVFHVVARAKIEGGAS